MFEKITSMLKGPYKSKKMSIENLAEGSNEMDEITPTSRMSYRISYEEFLEGYESGKFKITNIPGMVFGTGRIIDFNENHFKEYLVQHKKYEDALYINDIFESPIDFRERVKFARKTLMLLADEDPTKVYTKETDLDKGKGTLTEIGCKLPDGTVIEVGIRYYIITKDYAKKSLANSKKEYKG